MRDKAESEQHKNHVCCFDKIQEPSTPWNNSFTAIYKLSSKLSKEDEQDLAWEWKSMIAHEHLYMDTPELAY